MSIDFVVLWVDGNDPEWRKGFEKWSSLQEGDNSLKRFRDWNNLNYMFRVFEVCTPWVRKIHFVTWGHLPDWLNTEHQKLNIVRHEDILEVSKLPIFNSHSLETNIHRIKGLSEKFVFFNDDMFITKPLNIDYFFNKGLPRDILIFNAIFMDTIAHIRLNDIELINNFFHKKKILKTNFLKVFNIKYGIEQIRSLLLLPWPQITGFYDPHQPQPFLKKTFEEVWNTVPDILSKTSASKFRNKEDVNQYLFRYWQLMKGDFYPRSFSDTHTVPVKNMNDVDTVVKYIIDQKYNMLCINDELDEVNELQFLKITNKINKAFKSIFPEKSSFEL